MKILQSSQEYFAQLGIKSSQLAKNHPFNGRNLIISFLLGLNVLLSCLFLYLDAKDFKEYANCFYWTITAIAVAFIHIIHIYKMKNLFDFIQNFEELIQKRISNPKSKDLYEISNGQVEKWSNALNFAIIYITSPCMMLPMYFICYVIYFTTDAGNDAFQLQYYMWFPFNWNNPVGFAFAYPIQCIMIICLSFVATNMLIFLTECCWWLISLAADLTKDALKIDEKSIKAKGNRTELTKRIIKFSTFHSDAKHLVKDFLEVYEFILLDLFWFGVLAICVTLLMVQVEISQNVINLNNLTLSISSTFWSFAFIFMCCEFGDRVSAGFDESYKTVCQVQWYQYSMDIQRMFYMVLISVQKPVIIRSFGYIPCIRDQVKMVFKGGFSYFTMLQEFGK